jgi:hypothetical protein
MSDRKVRLFSFFTVISFLFVFRAWGFLNAITFLNLRF